MYFLAYLGSRFQKPTTHCVRNHISAFTLNRAFLICKIWSYAAQPCLLTIRTQTLLVPTLSDCQSLPLNHFSYLSLNLLCPCRPELHAVLKIGVHWDFPQSSKLPSLLLSVFFLMMPYISVLWCGFLVPAAVWAKDFRELTIATSRLHEFNLPGLTSNSVLYLTLTYFKAYLPSFYIFLPFHFCEAFWSSFHQHSIWLPKRV